VKILEDMREEMRGMREDNRELRSTMDARFTTLISEMNARFGEQNARFEVIETTLRDLAQQMVMLGRAVKVSLDSRVANEERFADHERRISELERKQG